MSFEVVGEKAEVAQQFEALSAERKALQAAGSLPDWYTTQGWQMFKSKYAVEGEDAVRGRHRTIAKTLARHMTGREAEWEERFFDLMWRGVLSPASPALANTGTSRGMPVSCSGQVVGDSVDSFYKGLHETASLSKYGFGTSVDFSSIRPRGSKISGGGKANGAVPVIEDFFTCASKISQGGSRRGSVAAYLDIEHPDWDEAIDGLESTPDGKNYGWVIKDSFVDKLKAGDKEANRRFSRALYVKMVTGKGYLFFVDKANRARPQMYKDLGLEIKASNLCVAPETVILTRQGHQTISELAGQEVEVWNGSEWSNVTVRQTGENQPLLTVKTAAGFTLDCTPYHKFYIKPRDNPYSKRLVEVRAADLRAGDRLMKLETPVIQGSETLLHAYQNGFYSGDGCNAGGRSRIYLYGGKRELMDLFPLAENRCVQDAYDRTYFNYPSLKHKFFVPDASYTTDSRVEWFAGLLDSDGTVARNGESETLQVSSTQPGFLEATQLMLQTLGIQSKVAFSRESGEFMLPANDGTGELKPYQCKAVRRLLINGTGILKLLDLGLVTHRLVISGHVPQRDAAGFVTVSEVVDNGRRDDTFCFEEPKRHLGVFNGLLTGQCSEIVLHSSDDLSFSCILSSLNLLHWDKIKESSAVFDATVFLDCLVSEFLEKSEGIPGLEKVREFTRLGRAIGLGVMGFGTYLQEKRIPYGSLEAQFLNQDIFEHIQKESLRASQWLAQEYGEPEWCKGYGVRNTHRTAVAPTKSTSLLMGGVSESVFPDPGMVFDAGSSVGDLRRIPPVIYELMKERGVYSKETLDDIVEHIGSVQHVDWLTEEEKAVFLTAFEIKQDIILRYASQRQKYICQGQSLNFYVAEDSAETEVSKLISEAVLDENILGVYYVYSRSGVVVKDECLACQA